MTGGDASFIKMLEKFQYFQQQVFGVEKYNSGAYFIRYFYCLHAQQQCQEVRHVVIGRWDCSRVYDGAEAPPPKQLQNNRYRCRGSTDSNTGLC